MAIDSFRTRAAWTRSKSHAKAVLREVRRPSVSGFLRDDGPSIGVKPRASSCSRMLGMSSGPVGCSPDSGRRSRSALGARIHQVEVEIRLETLMGRGREVVRIPDELPDVLLRSTVRAARSRSKPPQAAAPRSVAHSRTSIASSIGPRCLLVRVVGRDAKTLGKFQKPRHRRSPLTVTADPSSRSANRARTSDPTGVPSRMMISSL